MGYWGDLKDEEDLGLQPVEQPLPKPSGPPLSVEDAQAKLHKFRAAYYKRHPEHRPTIWDRLNQEEDT